MKKISVIIPVYNMEKYLCRCVDSILRQSYGVYEIILVDDGSKDSSPALCDNYANKYSKIKVIHKANGGLSSARNAGLDLASGEYISFIDSDDFIAEDMYEVMLSATNGQTDTIVCTVSERYWDNGDMTSGSVLHKDACTTTVCEYVRELMLHVGDSSVCTKLFPRNMIGEVRFEEGRLNEDFLFMLSLTPRIGEICYTGKVGYYYFVRAGSISNGYGKAIADMVGNSITAKSFIYKNYPQYKEEANRFALYQHMGYLLSVPAHLRNRENLQYYEAVRYIRKNYLFAGVRNQYLKPKEKVLLFALFVFPRTTATFYQKVKGKKS